MIVKAMAMITMEFDPNDPKYADYPKDTSYPLDYIIWNAMREEDMTSLDLFTWAEYDGEWE